MRNRLILSAILFLSLVAATASAATRDEAATAVKARYRITVPAFLGGFKEIGSVLTPRREGLRVDRPSKAFKPNVVKNGLLAVSGGGELPLGKAHDGSLKPGERLYLYEVRTRDNFVELELFTVATYVVPGVRVPMPLQSSVRFQYDGGLAGVPAAQLLADIGEWFAVEGEVHAPTAQPAAPPSAAPAAQPAAAPVAQPAAAPVAAPVAAPGAGAATSTVRLGQTQEEVTAIFGPPEKQVLLGAKTVFLYGKLKVIFVDGKVADAE